MFQRLVPLASAALLAFTVPAAASTTFSSQQLALLVTGSEIAMTNDFTDTVVREYQFRANGTFYVAESAGREGGMQIEGRGKWWIAEGKLCGEPAIWFDDGRCLAIEYTAGGRGFDMAGASDASGWSMGRVSHPTLNTLFALHQGLASANQTAEGPSR